MENQDPIVYIVKDKNDCEYGLVRSREEGYYCETFNFSTKGMNQEDSFNQLADFVFRKMSEGYIFVNYQHPVNRVRSVYQINQEILDEIMLLKSKLERIEAKIQKEGGIKQRYYGEISTAKLNLLLGQASLRYEEERIEGKVKKGKES